MPISATPTESRTVKNMRLGLIELLGPGDQRYVIKAEEGNFNLTIPGPTVAVYLDRGQLTDPEDPLSEPQVMYDQDQPMTFTFTAQLRDLGGAQEYITLADFVTQTGLFIAQWGTTLSDQGFDSPRLVTTQWWQRGARIGDPTSKGLRLPFCHLTGSIAEGSPNTISVSGTSYAVRPQQARWRDR